MIQLRRPIISHRDAETAMVLCGLREEGEEGVGNPISRSIMQAVRRTVMCTRPYASSATPACDDGLSMNDQMQGKKTERHQKGEKGAGSGPRGGDQRAADAVAFFIHVRLSAVRSCAQPQRMQPGAYLSQRALPHHFAEQNQERRKTIVTFGLQGRARHWLSTFRSLLVVSLLHTKQHSMRMSTTEPERQQS